MSTGENIKRIRKFRGMTQKELGIAIGIGEESASPRMAQYETDNRTPRKEMLNKMAVVLDVDPRNISIPTGYREEDMVYRLLVLEDYFPEMKLERNGRTGEVVINLQNKKINEFLYQWGTIRGKKKQGMISEDEYMQWKYCRNHA
ncbi:MULTISPECIES: helix-turn-helix domain-containing protein [Lachnospiraceae]|mgnify:CR=1 FL=1|uniref:helix-turn-helix domain-containing protein n=1 Tax=Lachnospiraceae TaxID=186803 RepID=UPI001486745C|nr:MULTISPECIES: helix-turn-helix transcriptional regulator [Lachnospiraceae]